MSPLTNNEFSTLQDSREKPFTYAATTRRCCNRSKTPDQTPAPTPKPNNKPAAATPPTPAAGQTTRPKSLRKAKPTPKPRPEALRTMKHTIILDHSRPETCKLYLQDAGSLTCDLQSRLEAIKYPLTLLDGAWSTAPFYKNFILTFSGTINFQDITKYNSILFAHFGENCHTAPMAGYQSILISGICLQRARQPGISENAL